MLTQEKELKKLDNQEITQKLEKKSSKKKPKNKAIIAIVSLVVVIAIEILAESMFFKCCDCGKWITTFGARDRENGDNSWVTFCTNCYDMYYHNNTNGNNTIINKNDASLVGGYELNCK